MFPSKVASYNDNRLIGSNASTAASNFDVDHPLYRTISEMTRRRSADPALRQGDQVTRLSAGAAGLFAFSRLLPGEGETLVTFNTSKTSLSALLLVESAPGRWRSVHGECRPTASAPGSYRIDVKPLEYLVCKSSWR